MSNTDTAIRSTFVVPAPPSAGPRCEGCGHARRIITDGLLGLVTTTCDECDRRRESRVRQEAYDRGAIARVAEIYGVSVEELRAKLAGPVARAHAGPKVLAPLTCKRCEREIPREAHKTGRPPKYHDACRPRWLANISERRLAERQAARGET